MAKIISTSKYERMLETANKRLTITREKLEKYITRVAKQVEKLNKISNDWEQYSNSWDFMRVYGDAAGNLLYSYKSNKEYIENYKKEIAYEERNIKNIEDKLAEINAQNSSLLDSTSVIVAKFEEVLAEYKKSYIEIALKNYKKHWTYVHNKLAEWKQIIRRAKNELPFYYTSGNFEYYSRGYLKRENGIQYYREGHGDREWKPVTEEMTELYYAFLGAQRSMRSDAVLYKDINEYLEKKHKELIDDWNAKILKVADKCKSFGINVDKITINVSRQPITEGNIDMWIEDGSNRRIYARMIVAAEYSDKVSAHIRFIVTEKKL